MQIRADVVREIARWWQQSLSAAEIQGTPAASPDLAEVAARFHCTEEEAIRGLSTGEQRHCGGSL
jgi:hypothetical protein